MRALARPSNLKIKKSEFGRHVAVGWHVAVDFETDADFNQDRCRPRHAFLLLSLSKTLERRCRKGNTGRPSMTYATLSAGRFRNSNSFACSSKRSANSRS